ncbi:UNVERIFIED_CONTAM: hypothetical protein FKN15_007987 [Acipenser sinensis]
MLGADAVSVQLQRAQSLVLNGEHADHPCECVSVMLNDKTRITLSTIMEIENLQEQLRDKDKQLTNLKDRVKSLQTDSSNTDTALATLEEALSEKAGLIDLKEHASSLASSGLKKDSKLKSLEIAIEQKKEECTWLPGESLLLSISLVFRLRLAQSGVPSPPSSVSLVFRLRLPQSLWCSVSASLSFSGVPSPPSSVSLVFRLRLPQFLWCSVSTFLSLSGVPSPPPSVSLVFRLHLPQSLWCSVSASLSFSGVLSPPPTIRWYAVV